MKIPQNNGLVEAPQMPPLSGEALQEWARQNYDFQVAQFQESVERVRSQQREADARVAQEVEVY